MARQQDDAATAGCCQDRNADAERDELVGLAREAAGVLQIRGRNMSGVCKPCAAGSTPSVRRAPCVQCESLKKLRKVCTECSSCEDCAKSEDRFVALCAAVGQNERITSLDLRGNHLSPSSAAVLARLLGPATHLAELHLARNNVGGWHCISMTED